MFTLKMIMKPFEISIVHRYMSIRNIILYTMLHPILLTITFDENSWSPS